MPFTKTHTNVIKYLVLLCFLGISFFGKSQPANYVTNGSFEEKYSCTGFNMIELSKGWLSIDSLHSALYYYCDCFQNVPFDGSNFQYPKTGSCYGEGTLLCLPPNCSTQNSRNYFKNRLKKQLTAGRTYCVRFFVNITNYSTYGIDGFGAYFGNATIDTITQANFYLPYLAPQIINANNNIIIDTLNWTAISGTFIATGYEKYMLIGNFKSDQNTNKTLVNPSGLPNIYCDISLDDASCIPIDLEAYAGPNKSCIVGDSVFIGREPDVEIDESCVWYKLNSNGSLSNPIDTVAGMYVKPITTTTYVVRQQLWCSGVKWDTVVVYQDFVGLPPVSSSGVENDIWVYPNPAQNQIDIQTTQASWFGANSRLSIYNHLGALMKESNIVLNNKSLIYTIDDLNEGVYTLLFRNPDGAYLTKRLLISRK